MLFGATLSGCVVGPKYSRPAFPDATNYTPAPVTAAAPGVSAQRLVAVDHIPPDWWRAFGSPSLDALVAEALAKSPTVAQAEAALRQSRELFQQQHAGLFPSLVLNPSYQRGRESAELQPPLNTGQPNYTVITAGAQVSFNPDVFGGLRRTAEGARATAEAARYQFAAARLTLIGNVVATTIQLASLDAQAQEQCRIIAAQRETVALGRFQEREGQIARSDVAALEAQLASAEAVLPPLQRSRATARDSLAVLTGRTPDRPPITLPRLDDFTLPVDLPVIVPARLVENRPDIRAAAANLRVAYAAVGVAVVARLPVLNLTASGGTASASFARLLRSGNIFWSAVAGLTAPLLDAGTLRHAERAARAGLDVSRAQYRTTVLTGLQNVADTLEALGTDARELAAATAARNAADRSLVAAERQRTEGQISALPVLSAQATEDNAANALIQAHAARLSDSAALYVAIGGGNIL